MNTSFWAPYISDGAIKAICWTLIHSLWIGMIIALLAGIVISLTRKSAAALRYRLLCGCAGAVCDFNGHYLLYGSPFKPNNAGCHRYSTSFYKHAC